MVGFISGVIYALFSFVVIILMRLDTNRRLVHIQADENNDFVDVSSYNINVKNIILCCLLVCISAICGYIVSQNTISLTANIQIGMCYMATLAASIIDYKTRTIPNYIPILLIVVRVIIFAYEIIFVDFAMSLLASSLMGGFLCALLLIIANRISKGGIGGGDIKLLSSIGLMCGVYVVISTLLLSLIVCIIFSFFLLFFKKKSLKDHLPFGPFIYMGLVIMCLFTLY